jgi:hypothetical protein
MGAPTYLTKGELRAKLLIRLGYGGLGAGAGLFVPVADDLLEEAQEQLFVVFRDQKRIRTWDDTLGVSQRWIDIPATCDVEKITGVYAWVNEMWLPLTPGIDYSDDTVYDDTVSHPQKYDIRYNPTTSKTQFEIWPKSDQSYTIRVEGQMQMAAFVADGDRASFDHRLILLYAIAYGKAHLGKADAKSAMDAWTIRLRTLKADQHGLTRYIRQNPRNPETPTPAQPRVV